MSKRCNLPYLLIAAVLIALCRAGVARAFFRILARRAAGPTRRNAPKHSLWRHSQIWCSGVPAICLYLVCEIGIGSTLVNFISMPNIGAMSHAAASGYLSLFWGGAMVGRFYRRGTAALGGARSHVWQRSAWVPWFWCCSPSPPADPLAMWSLIAIGLCHSVMFPTIFYTRHSRSGSSDRGRFGIVDHGHRRRARCRRCRACSPTMSVYSCLISLPAVCYLYVLGYALWGSRATEELQAERLGT